MPFPICISFNLLCIIAIERYVYVVYNGFYTKIITNKLLAIVIVCLILISFIWATTDARLRAKLDIVKLAKTYIALSAYSGTVLAIAIVFNVALLRHVKRKTQKSLAQHTLDLSLTKTIGLIIGIMVAACLPAIIAVNIAAYAYISFADKFKSSYLTRVGLSSIAPHPPLLSTDLYLKFYFLLRANVTHISAFPIPVFSSIVLLMFHSLYLHLCLRSVYTY